MGIIKRGLLPWKASHVPDQADVHLPEMQCAASRAANLAPASRSGARPSGWVHEVLSKATARAYFPSTLTLEIKGNTGPCQILLVDPDKKNRGDMQRGFLDVHPCFGSIVNAFSETGDAAWMERDKHIFVRFCPIHVASTCFRCSP